MKTHKKKPKIFIRKTFGEIRLAKLNFESPHRQASTSPTPSALFSPSASFKNSPNENGKPFCTSKRTDEEESGQSPSRGY